ncbi:angiopoietin-4-like [Anopheles nili]|uniref:angiopoietin-4-like n=1 Tax=Anopheles nili TaxID=185578 RepID=UPI00237B00D8|nr:angiopoietin-4-like [Anopheles nili]
MRREQVDFVKNVSSSDAAFQLADVYSKLNQLNNTIRALNLQVKTLTAVVNNLTNISQTCDGRKIITDCNEVHSDESGIFSLKICAGPVYNVYCNQSFKDGGWLVVYNRYNENNNIFNRTWHSYEQGFGLPDGEHFIGLKRLHALTYGSTYEIAFILSINSEENFGIYNHFEIDNQDDRYAIKNIGSPSGYMRLFSNTEQLYKFQTFDRNKLHPLARDTMIDEACAFWFIDMPSSHDSSGFKLFCQNLRYLKIMIRKL